MNTFLICTIGIVLAPSILVPMYMLGRYISSKGLPPSSGALAVTSARGPMTNVLINYSDFAQGMMTAILLGFVPSIGLCSPGSTSGASPGRSPQHSSPSSLSGASPSNSQDTDDPVSHTSSP
jgi:hypothetical protein